MAKDCPKCEDGLPPWLATFADLMSLLMCFFVLLLSFAEIDAIRFKKMADSMKDAFGVQREVPVLEVVMGTSVIKQEFTPSASIEPTLTDEVRQKTIEEEKQKLEVPDEQKSEGEDSAEDKQELKAKIEQLQENLEELENVIQEQRDVLEKADPEKLVELEKIIQKLQEELEKTEQEMNGELLQEKLEALEKVIQQQREELKEFDPEKLAELEKAMQELKEELEKSDQEKPEDLEKTERERLEEAEQERLEQEAIEANKKKIQEELEQQARELEDALKDEIAEGLVTIETAETKIIIRIQEKGSFSSGSADFNAGFLDVIDRISDAIVRSPGRVVVAGHTDNVPIYTSRFRSNWELSSARAVTVVHALLMNPGVSEDRVLIEGHADSNPLVPNDSAENRAKNRRVELIIVRGEEGEQREVLDVSQ